MKLTFNVYLTFRHSTNVDITSIQDCVPANTVGLLVFIQRTYQEAGPLSAVGRAPDS